VGDREIFEPEDPALEELLEVVLPSDVQRLTIIGQGADHETVVGVLAQQPFDVLRLDEADVLLVHPTDRRVWSGHGLSHRVASLATTARSTPEARGGGAVV